MAYLERGRSALPPILFVEDLSDLGSLFGSEGLRGVRPEDFLDGLVQSAEKGLLSEIVPLVVAVPGEIVGKSELAAKVIEGVRIQKEASTGADAIYDIRGGGFLAYVYAPQDAPDHPHNLVAHQCLS